MDSCKKVSQQQAFRHMVRRLYKLVRTAPLAPMPSPCVLEGGLDPQPKTWAEREARAEATGKIDYGCRFENGSCTRVSVYSVYSSEADRCCCRTCSTASSPGYLDELPAYAVLIVARLFDAKYGFWRPTGCVLPRKWRSLCCLAFYCDGHITKAEQQKLVQLLGPKAGLRETVEEQSAI
jgi:hypothetical protein